MLKRFISIKFITILPLTLYLSGCTYYQLKPEYVNDSLVKIAEYPITDVQTINKKVTPSLDKDYLMMERHNIFSNHPQCKDLSVRTWRYSGGWYNLYSATESIFLKYKDSNCEVENSVHNIDFVKCGSRFFLTRSQDKNLGYGYKEILKTNKSCYHAILTHLKRQKK